MAKEAVRFWFEYWLPYDKYFRLARLEIGPALIGFELQALSGFRGTRCKMAVGMHSVVGKLGFDAPLSYYIPSIRTDTTQAWLTLGTMAAREPAAVRATSKQL